MLIGRNGVRLVFRCEGWISGGWMERLELELEAE